MSKDVIDTIQDEETNLALHTRLCAQRYEQITNKFDDIDDRLLNIETNLIEIKTAITQDQNNNSKLYLKWAGFIIVTLLAGVGYLIDRLLSM
jgi:hypothetical protein